MRGRSHSVADDERACDEVERDERAKGGNERERRRGT